ncbi:MAG: hypothetical protein M3Q30_22340 [Actinomycetota bacterium]|nr:hypothetical protein [Actinomycetota bacterium]
MASRDRRPPRTRAVGSEPIPIASLGAPLGDRSVEDRSDSPSGAGQVREFRRRDHSSEPLPLSIIQWVEAKACFGPLWDIAEELEEEIGEHVGAGRPRECQAAEVLLLESVTWDVRSFRAADRLFADQAVWERISHTVAKAWPEHPTRRLSPRGPSRSQHARFRKQHHEHDDAVARLRAVSNEISASVVEATGMFDASVGSLTHPARANLIGGDATWIPALYNRPSDAPRVDAETGEIIRRRYDPDAIPHYSASQTCGRNLVLVTARNPHDHERAILDLDFLPRTGTNDATLFCDMALARFERLPGSQGTVYDMAMHAEEVDRILDAGRIPISKVQRTRKGVAHINLGEHTFHLANDAETKMAVTALDGTPAITIVIDGEPHAMPLIRRQTKRRANADGTTTIYSIWLVPQHPAVPKHLRGASVMIRQNSTDYERQQRTRRTRALRAIPESDPDFVIHGRREDNESTHHHFKERLPNGRARCVGLIRQRINFHAYQLQVAMTWASPQIVEGC